MQPHDIELEDRLREALHATAAPVHGDGVRIEAVRSTVARRQRNRWRVRAALVTAAAAAVVAAVLVAMPDRGSRVDTVNRPDRTTSTEVTVPRSGDDERTPSTSSTTTLDGATTPSSSSTTSSTSSSTSTTTSSTTTLPEFPPELTALTQGGQSWALYLAVVPFGSEGSPEMSAANTAAAEAGYGGAGPKDLACDQGAAEGLGREGNWSTASVYFESEGQATQARSAFEARGQQVVGIVLVTTYCLD